MKRFAQITVLGLVLAGCQTTTNASAPMNDGILKAALSGKTLVRGDTSIALNSDGSMVSDAVEGTWYVSGGKFCRTIVKPANYAGHECQGVVFEGDQVTFNSPSGRSNTYTLQ